MDCCKPGLPRFDRYKHCAVMVWYIFFHPQIMVRGPLIQHHESRIGDQRLVLLILNHFFDLLVPTSIACSTPLLA